MESSLIKSFSVYGLFGTNDVHIPFDENIKILIGENGIGKTQVLNIFYYTLKRNFIKLNELPFETVALSIGNKNIHFSKKEVSEYILASNYEHSFIKEIISLIGRERLSLLRKEILDSSPNKVINIIDNSPIYNRLRRIGSSEYIVNSLQKYFFENRSLSNKKEKESIGNIAECDKIIKEFLAKEFLCDDDDFILHFPTFRRVEEDLHNLGYDEEKIFISKQDTRLIHFGMDDVEGRFNHIEETINDLLSKGLAQFTTDILNIVVDMDNFQLTNDDFLNKIDEKDIEIILARVGNQLSDKQKDAVKSIVTNKQLKNPISGYLLQKLIEIYEKQKELDKSVKEFREVCNKYLINKNVFYDESAIKIFIKSESTDSKIELSKLSSGEKQIISIFSKIYLSEAEKRFIVLFDEPELSLSMIWQRQLLPDILKSNKCDFLLAVTHSPFIFDNELDRYAIGLNEYIKPSKALTA